jgi:hypothetical protein
VHQLRACFLSSASSRSVIASTLALSSTSSLAPARGTTSLREPDATRSVAFASASTGRTISRVSAT